MSAARQGRAPRGERRLAAEPDAPTAVPVAGAGDPTVSFRWGWYLLSVFVPFAGILFGIFFYGSESSSARRVGRTCLILGFVLWVVLPLAVGFLLILLGALTAMNFLSGLMPPSP